jgi:hypothetical protein
MKLYTVYFDAFGKKCKTTVKANSTDEARLEIYKKVKFIRFEEEYMKDEESIYETLKDLFK